MPDIDWACTIGFDLETRGVKPEYALQAYRMKDGLAEISAASFATFERGTCEMDPASAWIESRLRFAAERGLYVVTWNGCFDVSWCIAAGLGDLCYEVKWLDAMLLWRHLCVFPEGEDVPKSKRKSYSLKAAMAEFFPGEGSFKEFDNFQAQDAESLALLKERNVKDAQYTLKLAKLFWDQLDDSQRVAALIEARCIPMVAETYVTGLPISESGARELSNKLQQQGDQMYADLLASSPEVGDYDIGSPKQLSTLLFDVWGLPILSTSEKTGVPSTDKAVLYELASIDPRARTIKEIREAKNNRTKFAEGVLASVEYNGDGASRPQMKIFGTYTGRATYYSKQTAKVQRARTLKSGEVRYSEVEEDLPTGFALHQTKRGREYRDLIRAPEGCLMVEWDAAGQEFRWMAVVSGDETMLGLCAPGEDAHSYMGSQISGADYREIIRLVDEEDAEAANIRKLGKFCNLSYQYRVYPKTATKKARVEYGMDVQEPFIAGTLETYQRSYPGVPRYWVDAVRTAQYKGYAETFAGRRVQLKDWRKSVRWSTESTAINYPIQGSGGDQKYLALSALRSHLNKYDGKFLFDLHDGIYCVFPIAKAEKAAVELMHLLSNLPYKQVWGVDLPIQFPFDCKMGPTWGSLKKVH
jgi:DNA polymerase I